MQTDLNISAPPAPVRANVVTHEEVPERHTVSGHDMIFHAPVYGDVDSDGGVVRLESTLGWGSVVNPGGQILSRRRVFNATLQAQGGRVEVQAAESCLIIGRDVVVREAVNCQIFAHTLRLGTATGCMIAGRNLEIRQARPFKGEPNMITVVVPALPDLQEILDPLHAEIASMKASVDGLTARIQALRADNALTHYLSIRSKVRSGMLTLSDDQAKGYAQMEERLGEAARALEAAVAERRPIATALTENLARVQALRDARTAQLADCRCQIMGVAGETIVRQLIEAQEDADLSQIALPMIPKILFRNDASLKFLCTLREGQLNWSAAKAS